MDREITEQERKVYEDSVKRNKEELEILEWDLENKQRSLDKGLDIAFKAMRRQTRAEHAATKTRIDEVRFALNDAEDKLGGK